MVTGIFIYELVPSKLYALLSYPNLSTLKTASPTVPS